MSSPSIPENPEAAPPTPPTGHEVPTHLGQRPQNPDGTTPPTRPATPVETEASSEPEDPAQEPPAPGKKERKRKRGGKAKQPTTRSRLRKLALAAFALWTVSCLTAGVVLGWMINDRMHQARTTEGPEVIEVPMLADAAGFAMPDLRGLSLTDAKQVLVDSGSSADLVDVVEVEWGGQVGVVITQDPVSGEQVKERITLQVSKQALMPDVLGQSELEAVDKLKALGTETVVEQRFDLASRTGTVLETSVAVGEPLPTVVTLVVAQPGTALFLSQLEAADGGCSSKDGRLNGKEYPNSTECRSGTAQYPATSVWLLDRKAHQLSGVIGVDDRGKTDAVVQVVITGDGAELANVTATYANPVEVSVSVKDVLRLEVTVLSENQSQAVLGDMLVKGLPEEIATLEKSR